MFFGDPVQITRFDIQKYPIFEKLTVQQTGFFWKPEEIDVSRDKSDFESRLTEAEKHIFLSNIQYQILLDSVQGREPVLAFLPHASEPEVENWLVTWSFFETIHSRSYTHLLRNSFNDPSPIFDEIPEHPEIMLRADAINKYYDDFKNNPSIDTLYLCMMSVNILEAIRFYVSFACSFSFGERDLMVGNADIIKLIARDENLHLIGTQNFIKIMRKEHPELEKKHADECYDMFYQASTQEIEWAEYLFSKGGMVGLNVEVLTKYVHWLTNKRMKQVGMHPLYEKVENPLPWMSNWLNSDNFQVAPQEREITSYVTGAIDKNYDVNCFKGFQL